VRTEILDYLVEAKTAGVSSRTVCALIGISTRTIQNWRCRGTVDKRKGSARFVAHRLSAEEEQRFFDLANTARFRDKSAEQIVAQLADENEYLASASTLSRILRKRAAMEHRRESKKPANNSRQQPITVTGPNQLWAWDITWLRTSVVGLFLYAYTIIDVYDRSIVGWTIELNESDEHAAKLFARVIRDLKVITEIIHADNGNAMRGMTLAVFLDMLCISRSYSRPRCSNDNAFIESWHKTLKYSVGYPKCFQDIKHARAWYADFINWYNNAHLHSSLDYVTPIQCRTGAALQIYERRNQAIVSAYTKNPLRWRQGKVRRYGYYRVETYYRPILSKNAA